MREYYARYFREVLRDLSWFTKGQVIVSLLAGIGTAFVGNALGAITDALVWKSAGAGVICYAVILVGRAIWAGVNAPVELDNQRQLELAGQQQAHSLTIINLNNTHSAQIGEWAKGATDTNSLLAQCREELVALKSKPTRTPAQEQYHREATVALGNSSEDAKRMIKHVLRHGPQVFDRFAPPDLPAGIAGSAADTLLSQCCQAGLMSRRHLNTSVGGGAEYYLTDDMKTVLEQILFS